MQNNLENSVWNFCCLHRRNLCIQKKKKKKTVKNFYWLIYYLTIISNGRNLWTPRIYYLYIYVYTFVHIHVYTVYSSQIYTYIRRKLQRLSKCRTLVKKTCPFFFAIDRSPSSNRQTKTNTQCFAIRSAHESLSLFLFSSSLDSFFTLPAHFFVLVRLSESLGYITHGVYRGTECIRENKGRFSIKVVGYHFESPSKGKRKQNGRRAEQEKKKRIKIRRRNCVSPWVLQLTGSCSQLLSLHAVTGWRARYGSSSSSLAEKNIRYEMDGNIEKSNERERERGGGDIVVEKLRDLEMEMTEFFPSLNSYFNARFFRVHRSPPSIVHTVFSISIWPIQDKEKKSAGIYTRTGDFPEQWESFIATVNVHVVPLSFVKVIYFCEFSISTDLTSR